MSTDEPKTASGIEVTNLTKTYRSGKVQALGGVTVGIRPGETFGLIGPNGAGKTTFMGCLLSLLNPDSGVISINGLLPDDLSLRQQTGYMPERLDFERWKTARQFLEYHHSLARLPSKTRRADVEAMLARLGLETSSWDQRLSKYSRGMLQRLGLAQALIGDPQFLFLDEPSSGIDPAGVRLVRHLLLDLKREGRVTVVLNSHQLDEVERVCDRVAFIRSGHVEAIENLHDTDDRERTLTIRWSDTANGLASAERLCNIAKETGVVLRDYSSRQARFAVPGDQQASKLIALMVSEKIPVVEASNEDSLLEKFFPA